MKPAARWFTPPAATAYLALLLLCGCASSPPRERALPPPPTFEDAAATARAEREARLQRWQLRQQQAAEAAEAQGLWAQAAWHWESLRAVQPQDEELNRRLRRSLEAAQDFATLRTQQARLALQLGQAAQAQQLFERALLAQPTHAEALQGLRQLLQQAWLQAAQQLPAPPQVMQGRGPRAALEHSQLLALQGEHAAAIALLPPPRDASERRWLASLHWQHALALRPTDEAAALQQLRRSLQLDPANAQAREQLRRWQARPAPAAPAAPRVR